MWFGIKKQAASLYQDELHRRVFATASGSRPKGADKLKKLGKKKKRKGWFKRLFSRSK